MTLPKASGNNKLLQLLNETCFNTVYQYFSCTLLVKDFINLIFNLAGQ